MNKEQIQEDEYQFPYHHLVDLQPFSETKHLFWGLEYAAYLSRVSAVVQEAGHFDSLIDIGCGDGRLLAEVRKRSKARLVGQDYSEHAIELARALVSDVEFMTTLPASGEFDAFTCIEVVEHIEPAALPEFATNCAKAVKPGAFGVITTPSINTPLQDKHYRHFTPELLSAPFAKDFEIIRIEWLNARAFGARLIQRLLANRLFILNYAPLVQGLFGWYMRQYLTADSMTGGRLLMVVRKK